MIAQKEVPCTANQSPKAAETAAENIFPKPANDRFLRKNTEYTAENGEFANSRTAKNFDSAHGETADKTLYRDSDNDGTAAGDRAAQGKMTTDKKRTCRPSAEKNNNRKPIGNVTDCCIKTDTTTDSHGKTDAATGRPVKNGKTAEHKRSGGNTAKGTFTEQNSSCSVQSRAEGALSSEQQKNNSGTSFNDKNSQQKNRRIPFFGNDLPPKNTDKLFRCFEPPTNRSANSLLDNRPQEKSHPPMSGRSKRPTADKPSLKSNIICFFNKYRRVRRKKFQPAPSQNSVAKITF